MNGDSGTVAFFRGLSVWIVTWLGNLDAGKLGSYLAVIYTTMLIITWVRKNVLKRPVVVIRRNGEEHAPTDVPSDFPIHERKE